MALPYREFGTYFLRDLAETAKSSTRPDRITLDGNQVSRQFILPVRGELESEDDFAARLAAFKRDLPRGSDHAYRLAISHEAFRRAGEKDYAAAACVLDVLKGLPTASADDRRRWANRGVSHKPIKSRIGTTRRGRRRKRRKPVLFADYRLIESIRSEVSRYKSRHSNFDQAFEKEFSLYRSIYHRHVDFCAEEEAQIRALLNRCEASLGPSHQLTATHTLNLARVLHEEGKFAEAVPVYWLALARCWAGSWAPHQGEISASWILRDIENCQNEQPSAFNVDAMVKSGHLRLYHVTVDLPAFGHATVPIDLRPKSLDQT